MKSLAALVPNRCGVAPGQRLRIESWAARLEEFGWTVDFYPFEDDKLGDVLYRPGGSVVKALRLVSCYGRHSARVWGLPDYDVVLVHREAALIGPAVLERLLKRTGVPLVYDIDDPIFLPYRSPTSGWASLLKFSGKTRALLRMADHVIAINQLIANYASRFNESVTVIPTFVDTDHYRPAERASRAHPRLVWIGSHSTARNLHAIAPALRRLQANGDAVLRVISAEPVEMPGIRVENRTWSSHTEVPDAQDCHVGIVPLPDVPWNRWKFFFKTVQYMSMGLPPVARRIGSNSEVIEDGVNGFLVESQDEWYERLCELISDAELRGRMGKAARETVLDRYSADTHMKRVAAVLADADASNAG